MKNVLVVLMLSLGVMASAQTITSTSGAIQVGMQDSSGGTYVITILASTEVGPSSAGCPMPDSRSSSKSAIRPTYSAGVGGSFVNPIDSALMMPDCPRLRALEATWEDQRCLHLFRAIHSSRSVTSRRRSSRSVIFSSLTSNLWAQAIEN